MGLSIIGCEQGILTAKVTGHLAYGDLLAFQRATVALLAEQSPLSFLILTEAFLGWEQAGEWNDLTFMYTYDAQMKKMAIVVDPQWQDLTRIFVGSGLRQCRVQCFPHGATDEARSWLQSEA
jgi:hypothetical protein